MKKKISSAEHAEFLREARQELAKEGAAARAKKLTAAERSAIAKKGAAARWKKK